MKDFAVLSSEEVYSGRAIRVRRDRIRLPSGRETTRDTVLHPGAVVILPLLDDGRLVFIRQYRYALGRTIMELPAGTLEPGEAPRACAEREIMEETGYRAEEWHELGVLYPAPGFCNEEQHLFVAKQLSPAAAERDEDEVIEVVCMSIPEAEEELRRGNIVDGKSAALFLRARLRGFV